MGYIITRNEALKPEKIWKGELKMPLAEKKVETLDKLFKRAFKEYRKDDGKNPKILRLFEEANAVHHTKTERNLRSVQEAMNPPMFSS